MAMVSRQFGEMAQARAVPLIGFAVVIALLYWARVFFITFLTGVAIAFILDPVAVPTPAPAPAPDRLPVTEFLYARLGSVYQVLLMASFVPFLVYFMLSWRDHAHRSFLQFFDGEDRAVASKSLERIAEIVRGFVVGNFALGLLLAAFSSLIFWKLCLPYPLLTVPLSGFFSLLSFI